MYEFIIGILEGSKPILEYLIPVFLYVSLFSCLILIAKNMDLIKRQFKGIRRKTWFWILILVLVGLVIRILSPYFIITWYDEHSNIEVAKNIVTQGRSVLCSYQDYNLETCTFYGDTHGFPFILSIFFLIFGVSGQVAYAVNIIFSSLSIILIFLISYIIFKKEGTSLYASVICAFLPMFIFHSSNLEVDTLAMFFLLITFLNFLLYFKTKNFEIYLASLLSLVITIQIRFELILLILLFGIFHWVMKFDFRLIKEKKYILSYLLFLILIIPHLFHMGKNAFPTLFYGKETGWAIGGHFLTLDHFLNNYSRVFEFISGWYYPALINVLILIGILYLFKQNRRLTAFILLYILIFSVMYISYYQIYVRYWLHLLALSILFSVGGIYFIQKEISKRTSNKLLAFSDVIILLLVVLLSSYMILNLYNPDEYFSDQGFVKSDVMYQEQEFINSIKDGVKGCYVVMHFPYFLSATEAKGIFTLDLLGNPNMSKNILNSESCFLFFEDLYCTNFFEETLDAAGTENLIISRCEEMHNRFHLEPFIEYNIVKSKLCETYKCEGSKDKFILYKITGLKS